MSKWTSGGKDDVARHGVEGGVFRAFLWVVRKIKNRRDTMKRYSDNEDYDKDKDSIDFHEDRYKHNKHCEDKKHLGPLIDELVQ